MLFHPSILSYPWMILVMISMAITLFFVIHRIVTFKKSGSGQDLSPILIWGGMAAIFGMLGQTIGLWRAIQAILMAADVSPEIMKLGFNLAMIPAIWGFFTLLLAGVVYTILRELSKR